MRGNLVCAEEKRFLAIARIIRPQGRWGEIASEIITDFPDRFEALKNVFIGAPDDSEPRSFILERSWPHKGRIVLKLGGINSISEAESLKGLLVFIPFEERVQLPEDTYYWADLEGCRVITGPPEARTEIGTVTAVERTGGVPILHVNGYSQNREEVLIPFAREICREIDPTAKVIVIDPPESLLELNAEPEK